MILLYLSVNYFCHAEFDGEFCPFYVYFVKDFDGSRSGQFLTVAVPGLDLNTQDEDASKKFSLCKEKLTFIFKLLK